MRTVQMTLEEDLVRDVDRLVKSLKTSRSAFTRDALREAISKAEIRKLEELHRRGYERQPVRRGEFAVAESDRAWGDW